MSLCAERVTMKFIMSYPMVVGRGHVLDGHGRLYDNPLPNTTRVEKSGQALRDDRHHVAPEKPTAPFEFRIILGIPCIDTHQKKKKGLW